MCLSEYVKEIMKPPASILFNYNLSVVKYIITFAEQLRYQGGSGHKPYKNILTMKEEFFPLKEKFINPFSDVGFKKIFGSEVSKDLIIKFLNSLLNEGITDITFQNVTHYTRNFYTY